MWATLEIGKTEVRIENICLQKKNRTQEEFRFIGDIARIFVGDSSSYATMGHLAAYN